MASTTESIIRSTVREILKNSSPVRVSPTAKWLRPDQVEAEYGLKSDDLRRARKAGHLKAKKKRIGGRAGSRSTCLFSRADVEKYIDKYFDWDSEPEILPNVQPTC